MGSLGKGGNGASYGTGGGGGRYVCMYLCMLYMYIYIDKEQHCNIYPLGYYGGGGGGTTNGVIYSGGGVRCDPYLYIWICIFIYIFYSPLSVDHRKW